VIKFFFAARIVVIIPDPCDLVKSGIQICEHFLNQGFNFCLNFRRKTLWSQN